MRAITAVFLLTGLAGPVVAIADERKAGAPVAPAIQRTIATAALLRNRLPVVTATTVAPGQAGYVHFFIITDTSGEMETQLGIELDDQRIAWSVPGLGVIVSPFIADGEIGSDAKLFKVRHLYGLRPFPDDALMRTLQKSMLSRIIPLVEDGTPYCYLRPLHGDFCLNCLGFAMRVLFPGPTTNFPTLPDDFSRKGADAFYTTEDMLLYLAGLHGIATQPARLQRIAQLDIPQNLRDDLLLLVNDPDFDGAVAVAGPDIPKAAPPRALVRRPRAAGRNLKPAQDARPAKAL
jgi:hypothetical protein